MSYFIHPKYPEANLIVGDIMALPPTMWVSPRCEDLGDAGDSVDTGEYDTHSVSPNVRDSSLIWTYVMAKDWLAEYDR